MVSNRLGCTTTQKKLGKVRRARAVVMAMLVVVAIAILLVGNKKGEQPIELSQVEVQSPADRAGVAASADSIYNVGVPPQAIISITQNTDIAKANPAKNSVPTVVASQTPYAQPVSPKVSQLPAGDDNGEEKLPEYHLVAPGDTLSGISGKYYGRTSMWKEIYLANQDILTSPTALKVGQKLKVPPHKVVCRSAKRDKGTHPKSATVSGNYVATSSGEVEYNPQFGSRYHVVRRGETLAGIAKRERVSFLALYDVNRELLNNNPDRLREGMKVVIPEQK